MAVVSEIIVHHSGHVGDNAHASSRHLTALDIARAHEARWNFPSQYMKGENRFAGYQFVIEMDGDMHQCRAVGEEGAHCKGHNLSSVGICLTGNFGSGGPDYPTPEQIATLKDLLITLCEGKPEVIHRRFVVAPNTTFNFSGARILPHREYSQTECFGWGLTHYWARNLYIGYLSEKLRILQDLLKLYFALKNALTIKPVAGLGGSDREGCFIS